MGLAVYTSRLSHSWVFTGIVLISAATLLHPATAGAVAAQAAAKTSTKTKSAGKTKAVKKSGGKTAAKTKAAPAKVAKTPSRAKVAKGSTKNQLVKVSSRKASASRGGAPQIVAVRSVRASGRRIATKASRRVGARYAIAKARRPGAALYLPNIADDELLQIAARHLGTPYRFGGAGIDGFDCSGLVRNVFAEVGMDLPHSARAQFSMGERVASDELQPGDLVFFRTYRRDASHVGIYVGDSLFIHAASRGTEVRLDSLGDAYYRTHYLGARRMRAADS